MKSQLLITVLFFSSLATAKVFQYSSGRLNSARAGNLISSDTLIVKLKHESSFKSDLGELYPFFKTKTGTWNYLKLNFIPDAEIASVILKELSAEDSISYAYFAPKAVNAEVDEFQIPDLTVMTTPDLESKQLHLNNPPQGVGARAAWEIPGGTGKNVKVIDIEVCFQDDHEDFKTPFWNGQNPRTCSSTNHGTAVWGEVAAKRDGKGVTGIAYDSEFGIFGFLEGEWEDVNDQYIAGINSGIQGAMEQLSAGDVLIIEQQMVGPDLKKYTAVEYWPHIYDQLKAATEKGIICLEAAGNGSSNLDDPSYGGAFDLSVRDSGCIMVGAVAQTSFDRLDFSNYGSRVDASGFGRGVVTTGYGHLFNAGPDRMYTDRFSGTSSATPIVSGAVAVVSSIAKEKGLVISPARIRAALRATGITQSENTADKRVGPFPVIAELLKTLGI